MMSVARCYGKVLVTQGSPKPSANDVGRVTLPALYVSHT